VAASFYQTSVSFAKINTVQYTQNIQQYEITTLTTLLISDELLPQYNIKAAFVHSQSSLSSDVSQDLPTYNNQNVTQLSEYKVGYCLLTQSDSYQKSQTANIQGSKYHIIYSVHRTVTSC
jgi:hypothetical protein